MSKKPTSSKPASCINPDCFSKGNSRRVAARGLCAACYRALSRYVEAGAITWEQAERDQHCLKCVPHASRDRRFPSISGAKIVKPRMRQCRGAELK